MHPLLPDALISLVSRLLDEERSRPVARAAADAAEKAAEEVVKVDTARRRRVYRVLRSLKRMDGLCAVAEGIEAVEQDHTSFAVHGLPPVAIVKTPTVALVSKAVDMGLWHVVEFALAVLTKMGTLSKVPLQYPSSLLPFRSSSSAAAPVPDTASASLVVSAHETAVPVDSGAPGLAASSLPSNVEVHVCTDAASSESSTLTQCAGLLRVLSERHCGPSLLSTSALMKVASLATVTLTFGHCPASAVHVSLHSIRCLIGLSAECAAAFALSEGFSCVLGVRAGTDDKPRSVGGGDRDAEIRSLQQAVLRHCLSSADHTFNGIVFGIVKQIVSRVAKPGGSSAPPPTVAGAAGAAGVAGAAGAAGVAASAGHALRRQDRAATGMARVGAVPDGVLDGASAVGQQREGLASGEPGGQLSHATLEAGVPLSGLLAATLSLFSNPVLFMAGLSACARITSNATGSGQPPSWSASLLPRGDIQRLHGLFSTLLKSAVLPEVPSESCARPDLVRSACPAPPADLLLESTYRAHVGELLSSVQAQFRKRLLQLLHQAVRDLLGTSQANPSRASTRRTAANVFDILVRQSIEDRPFRHLLLEHDFGDAAPAPAGPSSTALVPARLSFVDLVLQRVLRCLPDMGSAARVFSGFLSVVMPSLSGQVVRQLHSALLHHLDGKDMVGVAGVGNVICVLAKKFPAVARGLVSEGVMDTAFRTLRVVDLCQPESLSFVSPVTDLLEALTGQALLQPAECRPERVPHVAPVDPEGPQGVWQEAVEQAVLRGGAGSGVAHALFSAGAANPAVAVVPSVESRVLSSDAALATTNSSPAAGAAVDTHSVCGSRDGAVGCPVVADAPTSPRVHGGGAEGSAALPGPSVVRDGLDGASTLGITSASIVRELLGHSTDFDHAERVHGDDGPRREGQGPVGLLRRRTIHNHPQLGTVVMLDGTRAREDSYVGDAMDPHDLTGPGEQARHDVHDRDEDGPDEYADLPDRREHSDDTSSGEGSDHHDMDDFDEDDDSSDDEDLDDLELLAEEEDHERAARMAADGLPGAGDDEYDEDERVHGRVRRRGRQARDGEGGDEDAPEHEIHVVLSGVSDVRGLFASRDDELGVSDRSESGDGSDSLGGGSNDGSSVDDIHEEEDASDGDMEGGGDPRDSDHDADHDVLPLRVGDPRRSGGLVETDLAQGAASTSAPGADFEAAANAVASPNVATNAIESAASRARAHGDSISTGIVGSGHGVGNHSDGSASVRSSVAVDASGDPAATGVPTAESDGMGSGMQPVVFDAGGDQPGAAVGWLDDEAFRGLHRVEDEVQLVLGGAGLGDSDGDMHVEFDVSLSSGEDDADADADGDGDADGDLDGDRGVILGGPASRLPGYRLELTRSGARGALANLLFHSRPPPVSLLRRGDAGDGVFEHDSESDDDVEGMIGSRSGYGGLAVPRRSGRQTGEWVDMDAPEDPDHADPGDQVVPLFQAAAHGLPTGLSGISAGVMEMLFMSNRAHRDAASSLPHALLSMAGRAGRDSHGFGVPFVASRAAGTLSGDAAVSHPRDPPMTVDRAQALVVESIPTLASLASGLRANEQRAGAPGSLGGGGALADVHSLLPGGSAAPDDSRGQPERLQGAPSLARPGMLSTILSSQGVEGGIAVHEPSRLAASGALGAVGGASAGETAQEGGAHAIGQIDGPRSGAGPGLRSVPALGAGDGDGGDAAGPGANGVRLAAGRHGNDSQGRAPTMELSYEEQVARAMELSLLESAVRPPRQVEDVCPPTMDSGVFFSLPSPMRREIVLQFQASLDGASSGPASSAEDNAAHAARVVGPGSSLEAGVASPVAEVAARSGSELQAAAGSGAELQLGAAARSGAELQASPVVLVETSVEVLPPVSAVGDRSPSAAPGLCLPVRREDRGMVPSEGPVHDIGPQAGRYGSPAGHAPAPGSDSGTVSDAVPVVAAATAAVVAALSGSGSDPGRHTGPPQLSSAAPVLPSVVSSQEELNNAETATMIESSVDPGLRRDIILQASEGAIRLLPPALRVEAMEIRSRPAAVAPQTAPRNRDPFANLRMNAQRAGRPVETIEDPTGLVCALQSCACLWPTVVCAKHRARGW